MNKSDNWVLAIGPDEIVKIILELLPSHSKNNKDVSSALIEIMPTLASYIENRLKRMGKMMFLKGRDSDVSINPNDITWIEADGSYTIFHKVDKSQEMLTATLASTLGQLLDNGFNEFIRIHDSYAINMNKICSKMGNSLCLDNTELTIGRAYRKEFDAHCVVLRKQRTLIEN